MGVRELDLVRERREFSEFIEKSNLIDLELKGRRFTWYKSDGSCKSRIDNALLNERWDNRWQDSELRGLPRSVSDHCTIVLTTRRVVGGRNHFGSLMLGLTTRGLRKQWQNLGGEGVSRVGGVILLRNNLRG